MNGIPSTKEEIESVVEQADERLSLERINKGTKGFVFMDKTKEVLDIAYGLGKNVILFGKGGYGKSEFVEAFFKEKGIKPFTVQMGSGMTQDRLFGGMDLKKFSETGEILYLADKSFMNHEYVIFEELFDAPDFILETLKAVLSSKVLQNGGNEYALKTKLIICCTNKTRDEFAKNDSLKALMERFPLEQEVKWEQHTKDCYEKLFETTFGTHPDDPNVPIVSPLLPYICEQFAKNDSTISPRVALNAAEVLMAGEVDHLMYIAEFKAKKDVLKNAVAQFKTIFEFEDLKNNLNSTVSKLNTRVDESRKLSGNALTTELLDIANIAKKLEEKIDKVRNLKIDDTLAKQHSEFLKSITKSNEDLKRDIALLSGMPNVE